MALCHLIFLPRNLFALESTFAGNYLQPQSQSGFKEENYEVQVGRKFLRGVQNFGFCWLEIPQGIKSEVGFRRQEYLPVGMESIFLGYFKGVFLTARRAIVGAYETTTAIFPQEPILEEISAWRY